MQSILRAMPSAAFWSRSATTEDRIATNGERRSICLDFVVLWQFGDGAVTVLWRCCDDAVTMRTMPRRVMVSRISLVFFKEKRLQREIATLSVIRLGLEPKTPTLKVLCSTSWASGSTLLLLSGCKDRNSFSYRQAFSIFFSGNVQKTFEWGSVCLPKGSRLPSVCLPFAFRQVPVRLPFVFPMLWEIYKKQAMHPNQSTSLANHFQNGSATLTNYRTLLETLSPLLISSSDILFLVCNSATKGTMFFKIQSHYPNVPQST